MDSAWEQYKLEARKMLAVGAADSHLSSARSVSPLAKDGGKCHRLEAVEAYPL